MTGLVLPALGDLITDDPWWSYPTTGIGGGSGVTRLRIWQARNNSGPHIVVVTELGVGVSITNGIEFIAAKLTTVLPGHPFVLLEHWPKEESVTCEEHLDQVLFTTTGPQWRRIWPTPSTNPGHAELDEWVRLSGQSILTSNASDAGERRL